MRRGREAADHQEAAERRGLGLKVRVAGTAAQRYGAG